MPPINWYDVLASMSENILIKAGYSIKLGDDNSYYVSYGGYTFFPICTNLNQ